MKYQEIRAEYNQETITVYQAYNKQIAVPAINNNRFEAPFSFNRMTWIKPSFLWLMERSGWATKSNQEYILGIKIKRAFWEEVLEMAVLTHPDKTLYNNGVEWETRMKNAKALIQWDPERNLRGVKLQYRSIQVGVGRHIIEDYNTKGIVEIIDYTPLTKKISQLKKQGKYKEAKRLLPNERIYKLPESIEQQIGIS